MSFIIIFNHSIEIYRMVCTSLSEDRDIVQFIFVHGHMKELEALESQLRETCHNGALFRQNRRLLKLLFAQDTRSEENIRRGTQEEPGAGVYCPEDKSNSSYPFKIEKLQATLSEHKDLIELTWRDRMHKMVDYYEVSLNGTLMPPRTTKECKCLLENSSNTFSIMYGPPILKFGQVYKFKVRGVNKEGPGYWSEKVACQFKSGPPDKPKKPYCTFVSATAIVLKISRPGENGSSVTHCCVKINSYRDKLYFVAEEGPVISCCIESLQPNNTYCFRISMWNAAGWSPYSDTLKVSTRQLIPGAPRGVHVSSQRSSSSLTLKWAAPTVSPDTVHSYRIVMRKAEGRSRWKVYSSKQNSLKFVNLESNTRYQFQLQAFNSSGGVGDWSRVVEGTTLHNNIRVSHGCGVTVSVVVLCIAFIIIFIVFAACML